MTQLTCTALMSSRHLENNATLSAYRSDDLAKRLRTCRQANLFSEKLSSCRKSRSSRCFDGLSSSKKPCENWWRWTALSATKQANTARSRPSLTTKSLLWSANKAVCSAKSIPNRRNSQRHFRSRRSVASKYLLEEMFLRIHLQQLARLMMLLGIAICPGLSCNSLVSLKKNQKFKARQEFKSTVLKIWKKNARNPKITSRSSRLYVIKYTKKSTWHSKTIEDSRWFKQISLRDAKTLIFSSTSRPRTYTVKSSQSSCSCKASRKIRRCAKSIHTWKESAL